MFDYLQSMLDEPWKPVSRPSLIAWLIFYLAFLAYAFSAHGGFLFIDSANLVVHEGGHNLFGWFGPTLCLLGRDAAAVAGPISAGRIFLRATPDYWLRFLLVFLFR